MRLVRNLLLVAAAAIAAMALMAGSAFAQSIEVLDEATGSHCANDVTEVAEHDITGGCEIHATSETNAATFVHIPGTGEVQTSSCINEFVAHIDEDGTGYIDVDDQTVQENEATGCPLEACDEPAPSHHKLEWPIVGMAELGPNREVLIVTFCIRNHAFAEGEENTPCTVLVDMVQDENHGQEFVTVGADNQTACLENPAIELSGHWVTDDTHDDIEIVHTHYPNATGH